MRTPFVGVWVGGVVFPTTEGDQAMPDIATVEEFASFLQSDLDTATANLVLLDLAQGLVTAEIGVQDPWPSIAKTVALGMAARAYVNPDGLKQDTVGTTTAIYNAPPSVNGVYLTAGEREALHLWLNGPGGSTRGQPQGAFPSAMRWPDPPRAPQSYFDW